MFFQKEFKFSFYKKALLKNPSKDLTRLRKSEPTISPNNSHEHLIHSVMRVNKTTVGMRKGWGKFSTVLETVSFDPLNTVDCETGKPSVTSLLINGLNVSGSLIFRSEDVKMNDSLVICLMVGDDKEQMMIVMEEGEEECEQVGWCSQFTAEAECGTACHQVTRQRCRSD